MTTVCCYRPFTRSSVSCLTFVEHRVCFAELNLHPAKYLDQKYKYLYFYSNYCKSVAHAAVKIC